MSKKQSKNKDNKKATKVATSKSDHKDKKNGKSVKGKSDAKVVKNKPDKKIVNKKDKIKKTIKPEKKSTLKKETSKSIVSKKSIKVSKPAKSSVVKKNISKPPPEKTTKISKKEKDTPKVIKEEKLKKSVAVAEKKTEAPLKNNMFGVKAKPSGSKRRRKKKKKKEEDDEPEIVHDELIEQLIRATKKQRALPKVPKILKTYTNPMTSLTVASPINDGKKHSVVAKKEPKGKFSVEYVIRTSAPLLYEFLTTPSGLSEWFADDVNIHEGIFTFMWDGSAQKARLLGFKDNEYVKLQWLDKQEGTYFEFKIEKDEITGDVSLIITDFADEASDLETSKRLWDTQVDKLLHVLGSY